MKTLLIIFACISIICPVRGQNNEDSLLQWDVNRKLCWRDFQGEIPFNRGSDQAKSGLTIKTTFFYKDNLLDADVVSVFYKYKSWVKDTSESLLNHEQIHFDITELYARKIRKGISSLRNSHQTNVEVFTKLVNKLLYEYKQCNEQYDNETIHGTNIPKQMEWNKKIEKDLEAYDTYQVTNCQKK